jgi:microcystin-dependent protein
MAENSIENPAPLFPLPIFIPENWTDFGDDTSSSSNITSTAFIGQITIFTGDTLPDKWVWCDGTSYPTSIYPDLFGFIGYTYGGSGANFSVPNCLGKSPFGADNTGVLTATYQGTAVSSSGNRNLTEGQLVSHNNSVSINPFKAEITIGMGFRVRPCTLRVMSRKQGMRRARYAPRNFATACARDLTCSFS